MISESPIGRRADHGDGTAAHVFDRLNGRIFGDEDDTTVGAYAVRQFRLDQYTRAHPVKREDGHHRSQERCVHLVGAKLLQDTFVGVQRDELDRPIQRVANVAGQGLIALPLSKDVALGNEANTQRRTDHGRGPPATGTAPRWTRRRKRYRDAQSDHKDGQRCGQQNPGRLHRRSPYRGRTGAEPHPA